MKLFFAPIVISLKKDVRNSVLVSNSSFRNIRATALFIEDVRNHLAVRNTTFNNLQDRAVFIEDVWGNIMLINVPFTDIDGWGAEITSK